MQIRNYRPHDCIHMMQLYYDVVRAADTQKYPVAQLEQWALADADISAWQKSFAQHYTVVAEENGELVGFGDIVINGYFNRLFIRENYQRRGIASRITEKLEKISKENAIGVVFTQITEPARSFFEHCGYTVMKKTASEKHGRQYDRFIVRKIISD